MHDIIIRTPAVMKAAVMRSAAASVWLGMALVLAFTSSAAAQRPDQPEPGTRGPGAQIKIDGLCPEGWQAAAPPLNWQLRCLPNTITSNRADEPLAVAKVDPDLFCPKGWTSATSPINRQLKCLPPNELVGPQSVDPLVVQLPDSFKDPLTIDARTCATPQLMRACATGR